MLGALVDPRRSLVPEVEAGGGEGMWFVPARRRWRPARGTCPRLGRVGGRIAAGLRNVVATIRIRWRQGRRTSRRRDVETVAEVQVELPDAGTSRGRSGSAGRGVGAMRFRNRI